MSQIVSNTAGLVEAKHVQPVLREMFPQDNVKTRMAFALAIALENQGKNEEAAHRLQQAIDAEAGLPTSGRA